MYPDHCSWFSFSALLFRLLFLILLGSVWSESFDDEVDREGTLESLDSVPDWDVMAGRSGTRNECRRSFFSASFDEENLDSGTWGTWSELTIGELTGGIGVALGLFCLMCGGRWS